MRCPLSNVLQLAYHVGPYRSVAVIGPGRGSDVLAAVAFGPPPRASDNPTGPLSARAVDTNLIK